MQAALFDDGTAQVQVGADPDGLKENCAELRDNSSKRAPTSLDAIMEVLGRPRRRGVNGKSTARFAGNVGFVPVFAARPSKQRAFRCCSTAS
jgi:hypothetical protein